MQSVNDPQQFCTIYLQKPTLVAVNISLISCLLVIVLTIFNGNLPSEIIGHLVVLALFAITLLSLFNWYIAQIGLVKTEEQRKELFGEKEDTQAEKED